MTAPMSAEEVLAVLDRAASVLWDIDHNGDAEDTEKARAAVAAMAEREAALVKTIEAQTKRIAELEEDFRRIEWLALNPRGASMIIDGKARPCVFWGVSSAPENTLRQAIDAARAEARDA